MKIRYSTVNPFFKILGDLKEGRFNKEEINTILDHPDYQIEFSRFGNRDQKERIITKNEFLMVLESLVRDDIELSKKVNQQRKVRLMKLIGDYDTYFSLWEQFSLEDIALLDEAQSIARIGLPRGVDFCEVDLLFTISISDCFGWPLENIVHFDVVQLIENYKSISELSFFLAHEIHHIGFKQFLSRNEVSDNRIIFLQFIAFEGLALKFCNYPHGNFISKCLNKEHRNNTLVMNDWEYYSRHTDYYFRQFIEDYNNISHGRADLMSIVSNHWKIDTRLDRQGSLSQFPNYFIGSEIFGCLFDDYGLDEVYRILSGESDFNSLFNEAMKKRGLEYHL